MITIVDRTADDGPGKLFQFLRVGDVLDHRHGAGLDRLGQLKGGRVAPGIAPWGSHRSGRAR